MYLVDTNVLSSGASTKAVSAPELAGWMERHDGQLYLSVITVAEVADGIAKARREGGTRKAERLRDWLDAVLHLYGDRVLPIDLATARVLGSCPTRPVVPDTTPASPIWPSRQRHAITAARC